MSRARDFANLAGSATALDTVSGLSDNVTDLETVSASYGAGGITGKNLIINGAMQVAQRGTSYSQSPNVGNYHTVDRYSYRRNGTWSGVTSVTLTQESSGAPEGFKNFLRYAPVGSDATTPNDTTMKVQYMCEGLDAAHLDWGTSNAKAVTLSFYVRSTVTGTFNVFISDDNTSSNRTIQVKEYTINSANTWERKTLTFSGPTSGNWSIDNGKIFEINWIVSGDNTGGASAILTSPDSWTVPGADTAITSNQTDGVTTSSGQTWDITGIQLEVGEQATPFEHRSFAEEMLRCQRYFCGLSSTGTTPVVAGGYIYGYTWENNNIAGSEYYSPVDMRAQPTLSYTASYPSTWDSTYYRINGVRKNKNSHTSGSWFNYPQLDAEL